ncbi:ParB/RepB/Spo0J family partition protein [Geminocystis sp. NIES-3709]|uniref:ParB/RepB/Spo0J family partition protein n=1 Tax=Geminocystis sp. NIES-3709 TaxID=1617448 RepID=UPI0005FC8E0D|nr:ParB/RepB/Spo0J family partition protein [Geminocystis sp. NIES-3709]BAQ63902.1 probable streptomycin biosynthesis operon possible regulatory protein [Geminocystis sp. NIES-3709]
MPTKKEKIYPDLSLNPNNIAVGDTVLKDGQIGLVTDIVSNNGHKVLQFWVKWAESTVTVPTPEIASSLQKIEPIPHDLVNTTFPDGSFVQSFIYREEQVKAIIIKESGFFSLFSLDQLQSKINQSSQPTVNIYTLTIDPNLQQRVKLNQDTIYDYSIALSEGEIFPPIIIWRCDDGQLYLVDGFHRVEASKLAKIEELPFIEKSGSYRDAMLFTISVNADHGLHRSNADKRKAVMTLLQDPEWSQLSTRELAKLAKVSHQLVHKIRIELETLDRRRQNWQDIKDYEEGIRERETENSINNESKIQYPEDVIKFLDDEGNEEQSTKNSEKTVNIYTNKIKEEKFTTPDIIPLNQDTYSLICDRHTIQALEKFMKAEGIESFPKALWKLLHLHHLSKNSP